MNEHKKYLMTEKSKTNKEQFRFTKNGNLEKPISKTNNKINLNNIVYCPFCLYKDKLSKFLTSDSKGISTYKAKCPDCDKTMLMKTINSMTNMNDIKVKSYSAWCFMYRLSGFWNKVNMDKWKERLDRYGWKITFWATYRKLKGTQKKNEYGEWDE